MADFSEFHSSKPINKEVAANNDEREGSDFKAVSQKNIDYDYALALLMGALNHLACDMALRIDIDPDYLFNKSLLASSININVRGVDQAKRDFYGTHYWLIKLLKDTAKG